MLFNSLHFSFFFIIVTVIYYLLNHKYRWLLLLISSCYFYMVFSPIYILILTTVILIDYYSGIYIEKSKTKNKKYYLIISLLTNIGILAFFKYYNFFNENLSMLLHHFSLTNPIPYSSIILPIGLSFHTFQAMSYNIEVYRGHQKAERNIGIFSLYVMFFPQLVAGPIERPQNLLHQFIEKHQFEYSNVVDGLKMILWGIFKKIVIADRLAIYVNAVYNNPENHNGTTFILATIFFAFQIYCDFSGYSEIAKGTAKILGFKLMTNFKRPYFSKNVSEFWKRWHISLSTWFKDYLYFSIGGKKVSISRWYFNLFFVFILSGLWHGANWTFIFWGAINGFYLIFAIFTKNLRDYFVRVTNINRLPRLSNFLQILSTFVLICFSWIFFRANTLSDALLIIKKIFTQIGTIYFENPSIMIYSFFSILFLLIIEIKKEYYNDKFSFFNNDKWIIRNISYTIITILIILIGVFDGGQFIYFQF